VQTVINYCCKQLLIIEKYHKIKLQLKLDSCAIYGLGVVGAVTGAAFGLLLETTFKAVKPN
jgi:hypothetical protein